MDLIANVLTFNHMIGLNILRISSHEEKRFTIVDRCNELLIPNNNLMYTVESKRDFIGNVSCLFGTINHQK